MWPKILIGNFGSQTTGFVCIILMNKVPGLISTCNINQHGSSKIYLGITGFFVYILYWFLPNVLVRMLKSGRSSFLVSVFKHM